MSAGAGAFAVPAAAVPAAGFVSGASAGAGGAAGDRRSSPPLGRCGDDAARIGAQGYSEFLAGARAGADLNAHATMEL